MLDIPGHSLAMSCSSGMDPHQSFGGDVLFERDRKNGFPRPMVAAASGIRSKFPLPPTIVFPGHGEPTTIGSEHLQPTFVGIMCEFEDEGEQAAPDSNSGHDAGQSVVPAFCQISSVPIGNQKLP